MCRQAADGSVALVGKQSIAIVEARALLRDAASVTEARRAVLHAPDRQEKEGGGIGATPIPRLGGASGAGVAFTAAEWSPLWCDARGGCVLASLAVDGTARVHECVEPSTRRWTVAAKVPAAEATCLAWSHVVTVRRQADAQAHPLMRGVSGESSGSGAVLGAQSPRTRAGRRRLRRISVLAVGTRDGVETFVVPCDYRVPARPRGDAAASPRTRLFPGAMHAFEALETAPGGDASVCCTSLAWGSMCPEGPLSVLPRGASAGAEVSAADGDGRVHFLAQGASDGRIRLSVASFSRSAPLDSLSGGRISRLTVELVAWRVVAPPDARPVTGLLLHDAATTQGALPLGQRADVLLAFTKGTSVGLWRSDPREFAVAPDIAAELPAPSQVHEGASDNDGSLEVVTWTGAAHRDVGAGAPRAAREGRSSTIVAEGVLHGGATGLEWLAAPASLLGGSGAGFALALLVCDTGGCVWSVSAAMVTAGGAGSPATAVVPLLRYDSPLAGVAASPSKTTLVVGTLCDTPTQTQGTAVEVVDAPGAVASQDFLEKQLVLSLDALVGSSRLAKPVRVVSGPDAGESLPSGRVHVAVVEQAPLELHDVATALSQQAYEVCVGTGRGRVDEASSPAKRGRTGDGDGRGVTHECAYLGFVKRLMRNYASVAGGEADCPPPPSRSSRYGVARLVSASLYLHHTVTFAFTDAGVGRPGIRRAHGADELCGLELSGQGSGAASGNEVARPPFVPKELVALRRSGTARCEALAVAEWVGSCLTSFVDTAARWLGGPAGASKDASVERSGDFFAVDFDGGDSLRLSVREVVSAVLMARWAARAAARVDGDAAAALPLRPTVAAALRRCSASVRSRAEALVVGAVDAEAAADVAAGSVERCPICRKLVPFESVSVARCATGHRLQRCAATMLVIDAPSRECSVCGVRVQLVHAGKASHGVDEESDDSDAADSVTNDEFNWMAPAVCRGALCPLCLSFEPFPA